MANTSRYSFRQRNSAVSKRQKSVSLGNLQSSGRKMFINIMKIFKTI